MNAIIFSAIESPASSTAWGSTVLFAVWICLGLATLGLLVMFVTGRGNVRQLKLSLMVSIMAHCAMALFSNEIEIPTAAVQAETLEPTYEVNELVVENPDQEEEDSQKETPVWEDLARQPVDVFERETQDEAPTEIPESPREQPDEKEPEPAAMQDLPDLEYETAVTPESDHSSETAPQVIEGVELENDEETVESRPEVEIPSNSSSRRRSDAQGLTKLEVERETHEGRTDDPTTDLRESRKMEVVDGTTDPSADLTRGEESESANPRTTDVADTLPLDDPGVRTTQTKKDLGHGVPQSRAFTRRKLVGNTPKSQGLEDDEQRNRKPRSDKPDRDPQLDIRQGDIDAVTDDTQLNITRDKSPREGPKRQLARLPATYQLRKADRRKEIAISHGASQSSEQAVENSLRWLAAHQSVEGQWDADGFMANCPDGVEACTGPGGLAQHQGTRKDRPKSGIEGDAGLTGLVVLTFLGAGYTHEEGLYADQIDRALRWLIRHQKEDGYLGGEATRYAEMYCHGMASIALGEAYGMTRDPQLREPLQKAIDYIIARQNPKDGGWRYIVGQQGDMSMFGWQLMALKSARTAGLEFPEKTRGRTIDFLVKHSLGPKKGLAAYRPKEPVSPSMTAEALFCKQVLGIRRENAQSVEAVDYLMKHLPKQSEQNLYYWYYGTLAMFQYGGEPWEQWNNRVRDTLVASQRTEGHAAGSWDPRPPWGDYGGRIYSTVLSTLCLEVYYRFLPMYRDGAAPRK